MADRRAWLYPSGVVGTTSNEFVVGAVELVPVTRVHELEAELAEARAENVTWGAAVKDAAVGLVGGLPAVDSPEDLTPELLRLSGDVIEQTGGYNAEILIAVIRHLEHTADRLEREQAEKAKRDSLVEHVAELIGGLPREGMSLNGPWPDMEGIAQALLDDPRIAVRFNEESEP